MWRRVAFWKHAMLCVSWKCLSECGEHRSGEVIAVVMKKLECDVDVIQGMKMFQRSAALEDVGLVCV